MRIAFRTDASASIGSGHVVRCLTLASAFRQIGGEVIFICRAHEGHLADWIAAEGHQVTLLPFSATLEGDGATAHAEWLGAGWDTDAAQTAWAIRSTGFDPAWVIVDHYAIDAAWERSVARELQCHVMAIDDIADRQHDCDILLDQNLVANFDKRYDGLLPPRTERLLGPRYALLQQAYRQCHDHVTNRSERPSRIFCYFGASDPHGLTLAAVEALLAMERPDIRADVVLGPYTAGIARIEALAHRHAEISIHARLASLAELMLEADLALGAGGATSWERICLGLPALVVTLAANQRPIASALHERNLVRWLGEGDSVDQRLLLVALRDNMRAGGTAWFDRDVAATIDGRGTDRVIRALHQWS